MNEANIYDRTKNTVAEWGDRLKVADSKMYLGIIHELITRMPPKRKLNINSFGFTTNKEKELFIDTLKLVSIAKRIELTFCEYYSIENFSFYKN